MYKKVKLDNGLRVISKRMPGKQSVALGIWIKAGGRYETTGNKGISHFLEHLLFKGTKKYTCRKLKESIEGIGGSLNGFTSEELTCYLVKIPCAHIETALSVLSSMVIEPSLPRQEVEKEKTVILEEIKMYRDLPQSYVHELLDELLWPNDPLGAPIIGSVESVKRTTKDDLFKFKKEYYTPSNIVVSAAGALDADQLTGLISRFFSTHTESEKNIFAPVKESQSAPQLRVFYKETEQTHLALGFHSLKRDHPLRQAGALLHVILGGNMSSRLFNEVREKRGLAYEIGTNVKRFSDTGAFLVHAGIDNRKVYEAIGLILKELKKAKINFITQDEFKRAKEFYSGQMKLALEDSLDYMLWIGETMAALDKTYSLNEIIDEVNKVTLDDVRTVARETFCEEKLNLALVGPLKGSESAIGKQLEL